MGFPPSKQCQFLNFAVFLNSKQTHLQKQSGADKEINQINVRKMAKPMIRTRAQSFLCKFFMPPFGGWGLFLAL